MKRKSAIYVLAVVALIISVFVYYQLDSEAILEKSGKGNLPNAIENFEIKLGMLTEGNDFSSTINEIPLQINNYGTSVVTFGSYYSMETFKGDGWYKIPFKDNIVFTEEALVVEPGRTHRIKINLDTFSYKFTEGKYRIIKEFDSDKRKVTLAAEFSLH